MKHLTLKTRDLLTPCVSNFLPHIGNSILFLYLTSLLSYVVEMDELQDLDMPSKGARN
jgi:hypothetical protein